jgi:hypothetical protein
MENIQNNKDSMKVPSNLGERIASLSDNHNFKELAGKFLTRYNELLQNEENLTEDEKFELDSLTVKLNQIANTI